MRIALHPVTPPVTPVTPVTHRMEQVTHLVTRPTAQPPRILSLANGRLLPVFAAAA